MKEFIIQHGAEAVFGAILTGFGVAYKRLSQKIHKQIEDQKSLRDGTQALLRNEIIHSYDKYIEQQWVPIYAMENVLEMYKAYHSLGGNGTITKLVNELEGMPSKNFPNE